MKRRKAMKTILIILCILVVLFVAGKMILFPKYEALPVSGKYDIGTLEYWVTEDIEDPYLKDGSKREVWVRVYYPRNYAENNDNAGNIEKLPVMAVSHGSCGSIDNNESLYRECASNGYVVLALGHPGHAFDVLHSNGKKQSVSSEYIKEVGAIKPQGNPEEAVILFKKWMDLRMADMNSVMDDFIKKYEAAEAGNTDAEGHETAGNVVNGNEASVNAALGNKEIFKSADVTRFITMGHSAGGSTALGMARVRDDVIGVIALESPFMYDIKGVENGEYVVDDSDLGVPVLHIYSDASWPHLREWKQYSNNVKFLDDTSGRYVNIHYAGTGHMGLCDLSLASPVLAKVMDGMMKENDPREQLLALNRDCMGFLNTIRE
ncbi:MAG: hypothetical protein Q4B67_09165 [Eubacteriales bacterium]|nr:hypothetical protein [Eubacteriales bacterium]